MAVNRKMAIIIFFIFSMLTMQFLLPVKADNNVIITYNGDYGFGTVINNINYSAIREHLSVLTGYQSRVTGYPSFFEAARYVVSHFKSVGVQPYGDNGTYFENYTVTVPIDHGSKVVLSNGTVIKAYALWPNYVNPSPYQSPPEGDELVYVRGRYVEDFDEKDVSGKFVLMDFNSRWLFRIAAMRGAKGVIYIGTEILRPEVFQLAYNVPLRFPRLYVSSEDGVKLKELCEDGPVRIHVTLNMSWDNVVVPNIVGLVPGIGAHKDEIIVVSAYLDSWSIVPAISPGATDAQGLAVLLDLATFLSRHKPDRSVMFVVLSGHWEGLWGAREWVDRHFDDLGSKIKLFIGLDLSSGTNILGLHHTGGTYTYRYIETLRTHYTWLIERIFGTGGYKDAMQRILGPKYAENFLDRITNAYPRGIQQMPMLEAQGTLTFDSEAYTLACYGGAFTFHTSNDFRIWMKTPNDGLDKVNFDNLFYQVPFIYCTVWGLLHEPFINLPHSPQRFDTLGERGFSTLKIRVTVYNLTTAYWDAFTKSRYPDLWKDLIIHFTSVGATTFSMLGTSALVGALDMMIRPDENGEAVIKGVKSFSSIMVEAYVVNRTDGRILWATDRGVYSAPSVPQVTADPYTYLVSIFKCGSIALFSLYDPTLLSPISFVQIYNHRAHAPAIWQSQLSSFYGDTMLFVPPDTPIELIIKYTGRFPQGILLNATEDNPKGYGYTVKQGETLIIKESVLNIARNLFWMNDGRYRLAIEHSTFNPTMKLYHELARSSLDKAQENLANRKFSASYGQAFSAWAYEMKAYYATMDLIWQVIFSTVFFTLLLIPFAVAAEKLLVGQTGIKRIIAVIGIMVVFLAIFYLLHPGLSIATHAGMVILSFAILLICIPLAIFILYETVSSARMVREKLIGVHTVEISRGSAAIAAFSTGIEHMKKRYFRTMLTIISLTLIVFALITFTSTALTVTKWEEERYGAIPYQGILVRMYPWSNIPEEVYVQIYSKYRDSAVIAPRIWIYPPLPETAQAVGIVGEIYFTEKKFTKVYAILGLSPDEIRINSGLQEYIQGRWFEEDDVFACLISHVTANNLTKELGKPVKIGSTINVWGLNLKVIGIFDGNKLNEIEDLDGERITPIMPQLTGEAIPEPQYVSPPHFSGNNIIIIPFNLAIRLRETPQMWVTAIMPVQTYSYWAISSIALKPYNVSVIPQLASELSLMLNTRISYTQATGLEGSIRTLFIRPRLIGRGFGMMVAPLLIGFLTILNLMFGVVHERVRDIKIYLSVGLSPLHVTSMFIAESLIYGLFSSVIGYIVGLAGTILMMNLHLYPPEFVPNYASYSVLIVVGSAILVTLLSSIYPAFKSSKVVLPSLERKWKMPKPAASTWFFPMPFVVTTEAEALGIFAFLKEFLEVHMDESVGTFTPEDIRFKATTEDEKRVLVMESTVRLAPYDTGVAQKVTITATKIKGESFTFSVHLRLLRGYRPVWVSSNRLFITELRKQFLIWRTLSPSRQKNYIERGKEMLKLVEEA